MNVWVVLRYYNARRDNHILGVFNSLDKAIALVKKEIEEDREFDKKAKWTRSDGRYQGEIVFTKNDDDDFESYEITKHTVI